MSLGVVSTFAPILAKANAREAAVQVKGSSCSGGPAEAGQCSTWSVSTSAGTGPGDSEVTPLMIFTESD